MGQKGYEVMSEKASDVLLIKATMDSEIQQYSRMELPPTFRDALIKQTVSLRMEQATQLLERFIGRYSATENHRQI